MKINVNHILEGIKNSVFVKEEVEAIANERYLICSACPKNSKVIKEQKQYFPELKTEEGSYFSEIRPDEHCSMCACNIHAKVRSLHTACPLEKWLPVATVQEAAKIAAITDEEQS